MSSTGWTRELAKKYVADRGAHCPFCGCDDIVGQEVNIEDGTAHQHVQCSSCDKQWIDLYVLAAVAPIEPGAVIWADDSVQQAEGNRCQSSQ